MITQDDLGKLRRDLEGEKIPTVDFSSLKLRLPVETMNVPDFLWTEEDMAAVHYHCPEDDGTRGVPDKLRAWLCSYKVCRVTGAKIEDSIRMADSACVGMVFPWGAKS